MQTASSRSKIAGFTLSEEKEKFNMRQRALLHHVLFMNLISYATKFQNNYDITAVSCRGTRSLKAPLCRENQLPEAVPVSIHRLLQLVIKHKLWIPEEERMKSWHADEDTDQNLRNTSNKPPSHRCGCGFFPFFLPLVSFDVVSFDILEVASQVILQGGHHGAVFVHQLSSSGLRREPVHHGWQLLVLHLLVGDRPYYKRHVSSTPVIAERLKM